MRRGEENLNKKTGEAGKLTGQCIKGDKAKDVKHPLIAFRLGSRSNRKMSRSIPGKFLARKENV